MNWALDAALAAIILIIIIVNTCKGFRTILNLLVTVVPFGAAYYFGPEVGKRFVTDVIFDKITVWLEGFIGSILSETIEEITVGEIVRKLPETLTTLLDRIGISLEDILNSLAQNTLVSTETVAEISSKIAQPISDGLTIAAGCIIVFIAALLVMFLVKAIVELLVKLPILKQLGHFIGFIVGIVNAILWILIISLALRILLDGGFLGDSHNILVELTENSFIYKYFDNLSFLNF